MRLQLRSIATAVAAIVLSMTNSRAVDIYVLSGSQAYNNTTTHFGKIDSATGVYSEISSDLSGGNSVRNLAWRESISAFYTTENYATSTTFRTLTTAGMLSSSISGTKILYGMAYRDTDNSIYAYDYNFDTTGKIDPSTGAWSTLNTNPRLSTAGPVGGRYAIMNDQIYIAANSSGGVFGTIGYTASSEFGQIASNALFANMVLATDGTSLYGLYGNGTAGNQKLYSINPGTGATTLLNSITGTGLKSYFYGAGVATVTVPEPSTYALAAIATGVLGFAARRRRKARQS